MPHTAVAQTVRMRREPESKGEVPVTVHRRIRLTTALVALATGAPAAVGQEPVAPATGDTLRAAEVVRGVLEANPAVRASRLAAAAAAERVSPAGAWPDPTLQLGLMNRPLDDFGTDERMTMNVIGLSQTFRWPGKIGFAEERAEHVSNAAALDADEVEARLVARALTLYYGLAALDRSIDVVEETLRLLGDIEEITEARYQVGQGLQQDVLQAQVAVARMRADVTAARERRVGQAARLNALMGRPGSDPVGTLELPPAEPGLPPLDSLMATAAADRPALAAARERTQAAEAAQRLARRQLYPDLTLGVSYGQRPEFDDMGSVMIGFRLPLFAGSRELPMRREAEAEQAAAEARALDLYYETWARLADLRAAAERAAELERLYRTSILPQAEAAVSSALGAYRVGQLEATTLIESRVAVNRYEIERLRLAAEHRQALAEIDALTRTGSGVEE